MSTFNSALFKDAVNMTLQSDDKVDLKTVIEKSAERFAVTAKKMLSKEKEISARLYNGILCSAQSHIHQKIWPGLAGNYPRLWRRSLPWKSYRNQ